MLPVGTRVQREVSGASVVPQQVCDHCCCGFIYRWSETAGLKRGALSLAIFLRSSAPPFLTMGRYRP